MKASNVLETIKAKDVLIRDLERQRDAANAEQQRWADMHQSILSSRDDAINKWRKVRDDNIWLEEKYLAVARERDLAIAHDSQPYPTADAYEKTCAALHKHRARAEAAEQECEAQKARAMRAEGERDDAEAQCASAERELNELDLSSTAEIARLRLELENIANAKPGEWDADVRDQFREWAQNRARQALTPAPDHAKELERDTNRCGCCGWPLVEKGGAGCWRGNCSHRPMPPLTEWYDPVRYHMEQKPAPDHAKGEA